MARFRLTAQRIKISENDVEAACLQLLQLRGWRAERLHVGKYRSLDGRRVVTLHPTGTPDYICGHAIHPCFYLETKRPHAELRMEQVFKKREIEQGYSIPVIKADTSRVLEEFLDRHEKKLYETRPPWD